MEKRKTLLLFVLCLTILVITGCGNKKITEDDLRNYVKNNMMSNWTYTHNKVQIDDKNNVDIIFNNVNSWVECVEISKESLKKLVSGEDNIKSEIGIITFTCKNGKNTISYVETEKLDEMSVNNFEKQTKYLDSNKNEITQSIEEAKVEMENQFKEKCNAYEYKEIFRNSEKYIDEYAKITGEVIQVQEQDGYYYLRVNMTKDEYDFYTDTILVTLPTNSFEGRILEDDIITFYGQLSELTSYESIFGETITLPSLNASYGNLIN